MQLLDLDIPKLEMHFRRFSGRHFGPGIRSRIQGEFASQTAPLMRFRVERPFGHLMLVAGVDARGKFDFSAEVVFNSPRTEMVPRYSKSAAMSAALMALEANSPSPKTSLNSSAFFALSNMTLSSSVPLATSR